MPRLRWTEQDDQQLKSAFERGGLCEARRQFPGRSADAIAGRAKRLKLHHRSQQWSAAELLRLRGAFAEAGLAGARATFPQRSAYAVRERLVALGLMAASQADEACCETIKSALDAHGGNLTKAAHSIGVHPSSVRRRAIQWGLLEPGTIEVWSTREINILLEHYQELGAAGVQAMLPGRTETAIYHQWRRMQMAAARADTAPLDRIRQGRGA